VTSTVLLQRGKNDGITVYVPKETILKEMAAKIKLSQHFFFDLVWERWHPKKLFVFKGAKNVQIRQNFEIDFFPITIFCHTTYMRK
jgi:hypothetical protein